MTETDVIAPPEQAANLRRMARVVSTPPLGTVANWLSKGWQDFIGQPIVSLSYGFGLVVLGWVGIWAMFSFDLSWMILPALSGMMLLGPFATIGLYLRSRGGGAPAAPGQLFLVSIVMMVLIMSWVRAATILFAVFFGLRPFAGPLETLTTLFATTEGIALVLIGSMVGGLFAALGFAISAFSFPMLIERDIDGFSAMALSFNASLRNFWLVITWGVCITILTLLGILTGLFLMVVIFPVLGYATWHAYQDLFGGGHGND